MSDETRIAELENAVKHLILSKQDDDEYAAHDSKITMEEALKRTNEHQTVFQKFLSWIKE